MPTIEPHQLSCICVSSSQVAVRLEARLLRPGMGLAASTAATAAPERAFRPVPLAVSIRRDTNLADVCQMGTWDLGIAETGIQRRAVLARNHTA